MSLVDGSNEIVKCTVDSGILFDSTYESSKKTLFSHGITSIRTGNAAACTPTAPGFSRTVSVASAIS